jgi:putative acetyltransferase
MAVSMPGMFDVEAIKTPQADCIVGSHGLVIRFERDGDAGRIREVNRAAFPTHAEADLVDELRRQRASIVSLVADEYDSIAGHILFSPVTLDGLTDERILGLAPMAVKPGCQRRGIGSRLVRAGLSACREARARAIVVVGHPAFYPRFGFVPASRFLLRCEYDVPDDVFMAVELDPGTLGTRGGLVRYHQAFAGF